MLQANWLNTVQGLRPTQVMNNVNNARLYFLSQFSQSVEIGFKVSANRIKADLRARGMNGRDLAAAVVVRRQHRVFFGKRECAKQMIDAATRDMKMALMNRVQRIWQLTRVALRKRIAPGETRPGRNVHQPRTLFSIDFNVGIMRNLIMFKS